MATLRAMSPSDRWSQDDVLAADTAKQPYPELEVRHGMTLIHTASNTTGTVAGFSERDRVLLIDRWGTKQVFRALDGAFIHEGQRVALRSPTDRGASRSFTPSGSVTAPTSRAQVAQGSRIWVEGIHDAELLETVWGDDLRSAAIVVEPLHGADDLASAVAAFAPSGQRRLGVLLDHLVPGTKESRLALAIDDPNVLICGHPYVDVWAAIDPGVVGLDRWPDVPKDRPWKEGVLEQLGNRSTPAEFWRSALGKVESYRDLATPLVHAVEQLIDFVTEPAGRLHS